MTALLASLRDIVLLRAPAYEQWRDRSDAMKRGVLVLLVCFLVAGSITSAIGYFAAVRPLSLEGADQFRQEFQQWQQFMPQQDPVFQEFMDEFLGNFESGWRIGAAIDSLETPLPRGVARWFQALGGWLSSALGSLGLFLAYGIWVLLFARLLGGNGGVDRFFGLAALFAVPNLLGIFSFIPCAGPLIAFIGWLWGVAVYVKAVQVSQRFDLGKAILATILPALILAVIVLLIAFVGLLAIIAAASQA